MNKIVITNDGSHSIFNDKINECYHSKHGAIVEAEHVFIRNGFSRSIKKDLSILEIGMGTGLNTLLTKQKANIKKVNVSYHAIELYPIKKNVFSKLNFTDLIGMHQQELLDIHICDWGKHNIIDEYFNLRKDCINAESFTTDTKFDIIYFDAFSPEKQPELWSEQIFRKMFDFLKADGFLVTYCAKGIVKRTMKKVGFDIEVLDGPPGKRQMTKANKTS